MKKFNKNSIGIIAIVSFAFVAIGLAGSNAVLAASSPGLGTAGAYSILAGSEVTNTGATTISGDVGISPGIGALPHYSGFATVTIGGVVHDADSAALAAQGDKNTAYAALASQGCDITYAGAFKELAGATLAPGVYCADRFFLSSGTLTLNGGASDVWIFKSAADLIITGGNSAKVIFTGGGLPCNVWWRVVSSATFDANSSLAGNILADTSITFASGASLNGRALARTAAVTLSSNSISGPTCAVIAPPEASGSGIINVVKRVINDNGGTKTISDFPLFINGEPVVSGVNNTFRAPAAAFTVTESVDANYKRTFSGDCDVNGQVNLIPGDYKLCIVTNNDIGAPVIVPPVPPLIALVKVPSPLSLPGGPGAVAYTYTLRNIGTVPVANITMVGDTCSPITLVSGDSNADSKLDVNETWVYRCSTTLSETHTNTVVATGWANGISATDIASATVVVGTPIVPPLIHLTKIPNPLTLLAGGGMVTYTKKITNPGTVALSNVRLTDDKCSPITYVSGDINEDSKLDASEAWTYTCRTMITETTTNTAIASGEANGLSVRDFAVATVIVAAAAPALPNTGIADSESSILLNIVIPVGIFAVLILFYNARRKQII